MGKIGADDAAVAHHQHLLAIGMRAGNFAHGPHHASLHLRKRLAPRRQTGDGIPHPLGVRIARQGADLLDRSPLPLPQTKLAQILDGRDGHIGPGRGDLGRTSRPRERARVDGGHGPALENARQRLGLARAELRQLHVLAALESADGVRDRLSVPREEDVAHRRRSTAASAASSRDSVSALPSSAATWKIGGLSVLPVTAMRVSWAKSTSLSPISAARPR